MAKLRAVIFDIGRVLVRVDIQGVKSALAQGLPLSPEELWSAIEERSSVAKIGRRAGFRRETGTCIFASALISL